jgi:TRAP-type transport system periplasmic protein
MWARRSRLMVLGLTAAAAMLGTWSMSLPATAQPKEYLLKYSDLGPPRGTRAESLQWWAQEIENRTQGRVKVKFFWSESLSKADETLKAVGAGVAETGTILGIYNPVDLPIWNLANAPFGVEDPWVGMRTWQEMRQATPELAREATEQGVRILMNFTTGPVDILSKAPILSERDLRGKKVRAAGGWTPLLKNLGATTVNLLFPEVYEALNKGSIDATINYVQSVKAFKHYEQGGHLTETRMGQVLGYGAGINLGLWNAMPEDIRTIISEVSDAFIEHSAQAFLDDVERTKKELAAGIDGKQVQFHVLPPEERDRWAAKSTFVDDWVKRMGAQGIDSRKIVETLGRIRAKYEADLASKGYPWARK